MCSILKPCLLKLQVSGPVSCHINQPIKSHSFLFDSFSFINGTFLCFTFVLMISTLLNWDKSQLVGLCLINSTGSLLNTANQVLMMLSCIYTVCCSWHINSQTDRYYAAWRLLINHTASRLFSQRPDISLSPQAFNTRKNRCLTLCQKILHHVLNIIETPALYKNKSLWNV